MSKRFRTCDLNQPFLFPPSLQDWLPERHLARFVADVVDQLDLSKIYADYGVTGHALSPRDSQTISRRVSQFDRRVLLFGAA